MFTEVPAVPRSSVDLDPPYDSEMDDSQSDNALLKIRGKFRLIPSSSDRSKRSVVILVT